MEVRIKKVLTTTVVSLSLFCSTALAADWIPAGKLRGRPEIDKANCNGYYIWNDKEGLHIRWCTADKPLLFTGRLDTDKPIIELKRIEPKFGGWARTHGNRIVLFSSTVRKGDIDGIDLKIPRGRRVQLMLDTDGKNPEPEMVYLGARGVHPKSLPLVLRLR